jgi:hypothetical protein
MAVVRFTYSRGVKTGQMQMHAQTADISVVGEVDHLTLSDVELRFLKAFRDQFPDDYLIEWKASSLDGATGYSTYRAFIPVR